MINVKESVWARRGSSSLSLVKDADQAFFVTF